MRGLVLLFSGQGMQHPRMLPWLRSDHPLLLEMQRLLAVSDWRAALADGEWASTNAHAQLVLTATSLAAWDQLRESGAPGPVVVAGYSVGELAACCTAGMFDARTALRLAQARAAAMDAAAAARALGMLAITGLTLARVQALCQSTGTALAIRNGPDSAVCAGPRECLAALQAQAQQAGAHCTPLPVRVASHTAWMQPAAERFEAVLAEAQVRQPRLPWVSNTGQLIAGFHGSAAARHALAQQIAQTVQWDACLDILHERQPARVLEIGPGRSLATMWNRRWPGVPARSADEFHSQAALLRWLQGA